jgi:hypothetical protein
MKTFLIRLTSLAHSRHDAYFLIPLTVTVVLGAFLADGRTLGATTLAYALFSLPGFLIFRFVTASTFCAAVYGVPLGISLTGLLILSVVATCGWSVPLLLLSYAIGLAVICRLGIRWRRAKTTDPLPPATMGHPPLIVALVICVYVVMVFVPLSRVGALTPQGYAFVGLFAHDFILRGADVAALANGIPSDNYFFSGIKTYNYYILWYLLPATIYNALRRHAELRAIISLIDLLNIPVFGMLLYDTLARVVRQSDRRSANLGGLGIVFGLLCLSYSYHWLFFLLKHFVDPTGPAFLIRISERMSAVSASWYKDFLFEPHAVLALMQLLLLIRLIDAPRSILVAVGCGVVLASLALTDTAMFLITACAFGGWYVISGRWRSRAGEMLLTGTTAAAIAAAVFALDVFTIPTYSNKIVLVPYVSIIAILPVFLLLVCGAQPVFASLEIRERLRCDGAWRFLLILLLTSLLFMLFVTESLEGNVFVRKSIMVFRVPLFLLAASSLLEAFQRRVHRMTWCLLLLAFPTLITDTYATSDIHNRSSTTYVTTGEMAAASWIKDHTERGAIVQSLGDYSAPGAIDYSLTVCFGERKAALGLWKMAYQRYPNEEAIIRRARNVDTIFLSDDVVRRYRLLRALDVDYVLIGPRERAHYPGTEERFASDLVHFRRVYDSNEIRIYEVLVPARG